MWKNIPFKGYIYASFAISIFSAILIVGLISFLPPVVPLFYGLPNGADQLVSTFWMMTVPTTGLIVTIINTVLTTFTKDLFFKKTLVISSLLVSILLFITVLKIISLVGFF